MGIIDQSIIIIFLLAIIAFGIWQSKFNTTTDDYFLAGRNLPWWTAMFSIVATETSVLTFISIPGIAYRNNWLFLQLAMGYMLGRVLVSIFLLPGYYGKGITSIYETIEIRFGPLVQKIASMIFMITRVLADGIRFLATAVIVQVITGWSLTAAVLVIGVVTLIYTWSGGIRTVVLIDSFQFILYLSGAVISILYLINYIDNSFMQIFSELFDSGKLKTIDATGNIFIAPWNFISAFIGGTLLSFASHGADYMMVQRVLGCKSLHDARKAMIGSGVFVFIQFTLFLIVGSLLFIFFGGAELEKDREFSTFIVQHLPVGIKGILLAGVLSAAMSTLSSSMNALASTTVMDWFKNKASLAFSKQVCIFWAAVLICIALIFDESNTAVVIVGLKIASYTYGGLLSIFILSRIKSDFHPASIITGLIFSIIIVFALQYYGIAWTWSIGISVLTNLSITYTANAVISNFILKK